MSEGISKVNSIFELDTVLIDGKSRNFSPKTEIMCLRLQEVWQAGFLRGGSGERVRGMPSPWRFVGLVFGDDLFQF